MELGCHARFDFSCCLWEGVSLGDALSMDTVAACPKRGMLLGRYVEIPPEPRRGLAVAKREGRANSIQERHALQMG